MKTTKISYLLALSSFSIAMVYAVANSFVNYETIVGTFEKLGYPSYLIFVIGAAQLIGLAVLILNKNNWMTEWAYAGFFMNFIFGIIAHLMAKEGNGAAAVLCIILLWLTYVQGKRMHEQKGLEQEASTENTNALRSVA